MSFIVDFFSHAQDKEREPAAARAEDNASRLKGYQAMEEKQRAYVQWCERKPKVPFANEKGGHPMVSRRWHAVRASDHPRAARCSRATSPTMTTIALTPRCCAQPAASSTLTPLYPLAPSTHPKTSQYEQRSRMYPHLQYARRNEEKR